MIAAYVGMFFGLVLGLILAGPAGGVVGVVAGMSLGMLWSSVADARIKPAAGTPLAHDEQSILCVPRGRVADVTYTRDARNGRWLDVERCSLCTPENEVDCAKRCLMLIRDAVPSRREPASVN